MKKNTILLLLNAAPSWLRLKRTERNNFFMKVICPMVEKFSGDINIRFFDSEYFHSHISDFVILETSKMEAYQLFIELLRDTEIYSTPYFEVKEIIIGQENAYKTFDDIIRQQS